MLILSCTIRQQLYSLKECQDERDEDGEKGGWEWRKREIKKSQNIIVSIFHRSNERRGWLAIAGSEAGE